VVTAFNGARTLKILRKVIYPPYNSSTEENLCIELALQTCNFTVETHSHGLGCVRSVEDAKIGKKEKLRSLQRLRQFVPEDANS
jgi:hypothetical protein